jgi:hypothetical protein
VLVNEGNSAASRAIAAAMSSPVGVGGSRFRTGVANETLVDTVAFGVYRKEVFARIGDFDEQLIRNQDDELNLRLTRSGGKILLVPSIQVRYFVRGSLRKLGRQYFQYGFWKIRVIRKHKHVASLRHVVPSLFLLALTSLALLSVWSSWALASLAVAVALYGASLIVEGVRVTRARGASPLRAALAMAVMHFSYGAGFLSGIVSAIGKGASARDRHTTLSR